MKKEFEWLGAEAFLLVEEAAKRKIEGKTTPEGEKLFIEGFCEGIQYLRSAIEAGTKKEHQLQTDVL